MASALRELEVFEDGESLAQRAVELFVEASPQVVALSGGSTPRRTYELLSRQHLDWGSMKLFLTDERMVPSGSPDANWRLLSEALLSGVEARVFPVDTAKDVSAAAGEYAAQVEAALPFDFVFLGLGADGHTASLFPGDEALEATGTAAAPARSPDGMPRVTLTYKALNTARMAVFLVTGPAKSVALRLLMEDGEIPAASVRARERLVVLADAEAALLLPWRDVTGQQIPGRGGRRR